MASSRDPPPPAGEFCSPPGPAAKLPAPPLATPPGPPAPPGLYWPCPDATDNRADDSPKGYSNITMCIGLDRIFFQVLRDNGSDNLPRAKQDLMSVQYWPRSAGQGFYTASQNGQGG